MVAVVAVQATVAAATVTYLEERVRQRLVDGDAPARVELQQLGQERHGLGGCPAVERLEPPRLLGVELREVLLHLGHLGDVLLGRGPNDVKDDIQLVQLVDVARGQALGEGEAGLAREERVAVLVRGRGVVGVSVWFGVRQRQQQQAHTWYIGTDSCCIDRSSAKMHPTDHMSTADV